MAFDSRIFIASFLLIVFFVAETDGIKCYQNQSRTNEPAPGVLAECASIGVVRATGCLKHTSISTNTVTRMCEYSNCTENGINRANSCYNTTDTTICCCLSEGCNSAPRSSSFFYPLLFAIPSIFSALYFTQ
uniref:Uncharacterized protein n=1 Tax=Panagrolaimus sp. PS1159 TaxID=55785 RepID=A0AC35FRQ6_9BILA